MNIPVRHKIQENETVFSWIARLYRLSHFVHLRYFSQEYFGVKRVRLHPYLPAHIEAIASKTGVESDCLLIFHTLYPLFLFFGIEKNDRLRDAMYSEHGEGVIAKAALPNSKITFFNGLKFCPMCEKEDITQLGFPIYRLEHQIPGVNACSKHGYFLNSLDGGDYGFDRKLPLVPSTTKSKEAPSFYVRYAKFAKDVLELARLHNTSINYQEAYRQALSQRNFLTAENRIRLAQLKGQISNFYGDFMFGEKLGLPFELSNFKFIGSMLRLKTHSPCHPAKHITLAYFLFEGDAQKYVIKKQRLPKQPAKQTEHTKEVLLMLSQGLSMRQITSSTGRSQCYIKRIAEMNNIDIKSNSQKFSENTKRSVIIQAFRGLHRQAIASKLGVSIGYVEQVISGVPGLVDWRKYLRQMPKINNAIELIRSVRKSHPEWLRKDIKAHCESAFFRIYHFNKNLLNSLLPDKKTPSPHKKDWKKEDDRIYVEISKINDASKLSVSKLDNLVNGHGALIKKLHKLPKTAALLIRTHKQHVKVRTKK